MAPAFRRRKKESKVGPKEGAASVKPRTVVRLTAWEVFEALSLTLFEPLSKRFVKFFELDRSLTRAGLSVHPVKYGAITIALTLFSALFSTVGIVVLTLTVQLTFPQLIIGVLVASIVPVLVLAIRLAYPSLLSTLRKNEVENELPFFMAYLATMVRGGYSVEKVVERVAELRVFKAIRTEARRIVTLIRMFGEDPVTALERVASQHPSPRFRDVILGYTTTLRSGGDVLHYLEVRTRELFESRATEVRALLGRLASFLEIYTIFGVVVSVTLFVFFAVSAALTAAQALRAPAELTELSIDVTVPALYSFIALPVMALAIALAMHLNQPRNPISYWAVYSTLLVWVPVAAGASVTVLVATGGLDLLSGSISIEGVRSAIYTVLTGLLVASLPPAIKYARIERKQRGLVRAVADMLRDISEIRKTGLSPEKCMILVSSRSYRGLTPVVERAAAALTVGMSLEEALRGALRGLREWFTVASFRFLADSITVGGGSPEVIDTLARYTQMLSELEEETRRKMRTQVFVPYFGAIMLSSLPVMILYMLLSIARIPLTALAPLVLCMVMGAMVNAYAMGLVAGKASKATVAAGFIHASLLTVVAAAASLATLAYAGA